MDSEATPATSRPVPPPRGGDGRGRGTLSPAPKPGVSLQTFRDDPLYPRIVRAVRLILARGKVVAPVDVLVAMQLLTPLDLDRWRRGQVPYLERVVRCNLTRLSRLLRILRFHVHDWNLVPCPERYTRQGKGHGQPLRFTKTGDPRIEAAYATHFVWPGKGPFHLPAATANLS